MIQISKEKFYFLDTFAGMGGLRIGVEKALEQHGYEPECVGTAEIKTHALKTLKHVYPNEDFPPVNIRELDTDTLPHIDGLIGGFPCQTFSHAGKRAGFDDTRGTLFYELARIMKAKQPRWALFENVKGLYTHDKGRTFETILNTFEELGYNVSYALLNSMDYGLANRRPRVYIVCHKKTEINMEFETQPLIPFSAIKEIVEVDDSDYTKRLLAAYTVDELRGRVVSGKKKGNRAIKPWNFHARGFVSKRQQEIMEKIVDFQDSPRFNEAKRTVPLDYLQEGFDTDISQDISELVDMTYIRRADNGVRSLFGQLSGKFTKIIDETQPLPTLTATDGEKLGVIEGDGLRGVTISEALKGLGYPEDYTFPELAMSNYMDLLGNTVSPPVITMIVNRLLEEEKK